MKIFGVRNDEVRWVASIRVRQYFYMGYEQSYPFLYLSINICSQIGSPDKHWGLSGESFFLLKLWHYQVKSVLLLQKYVS